MLLHLLRGALILKLVFPRASAARRRELVGWWSAKLMRIADVTVRVEGEPPSALESGAMIAANHVSWLDIFAISSVRSTRFIAKSEIRDWPVAGWVAERAGTIFIRRDRRRDTARINELVHAALAAGDCVGLFPEGQTTEGDTLLKFHSSLFEPAVANDAHVHPCAVRYERADGSLCREVAYVGERTFPQSMGLVLRQRGVVARISFAPALPATHRTRRELARDSQAAVSSLLGVVPGTPPGTPADPPAAPR
ncbi:MAG TPA: lysophospholipid acyltransferase family protein [Usitatibacter sp.]|nr:lysophospholipid acyltransferase family protein [Usitatibacter sp.]